MSDQEITSPEAAVLHQEVYHYVPHHQQKAYEALGWEFYSDLTPPHAVFSSMYKWAGAGIPVIPPIAIEVSKTTDAEAVKEESDQPL